RSRLPRHHRAVEGVRDYQGLHRAARLVAPQPSPGSGGPLVSGAPCRLRVRGRHARRDRRPLQVRPLVPSLHRVLASRARLRALLPVLISVSLATHYELYHDWRKAIAFCRELPDAGPEESVTFHMFWRERSGRFWPKVRPFGRKQALPVKAFLATQDLTRCSL